MLLKNEIYLESRKQILTVNSTKGKWDRGAQEKIFQKIDKDIERWDCVGEEDQKTNAIKAETFDLIKKGSYRELIPNIESNSFSNLTQSLQIFQDNPFLIKEVLEKNIRIFLPFKSQSRRDENGKPFCFVANIFSLNKKVELRVSKYTRKNTWTTYLNIVVILPQLNKKGID